MSSETTKTTLNDLVAAAIAEVKSHEAGMIFTAGADLANFVTRRPLPKGSSAVTFPKYTAVTAAAVNEATDLTNTAVSTDGVTITPGEVGIMTTLTDMAKVGQVSACGEDHSGFAAFEDGDITQEQLERQLEAFFEKELRDRRETIARTEAREATSAARDLEAKERGAKHKSWITVGDGRVSDECMANEAQGFIPMAESFTSGADTPPQHPNCRCTLGYRTNLDATDKADAEKRAEETAGAHS